MRFKIINFGDHETLNILENIIEALKQVVDTNQIVTLNHVEGKTQVTIKGSDTINLNVTGYLDSKTTEGTGFTIFEATIAGRTVTFSDATALYGIMMY